MDIFDAHCHIIDPAFPLVANHGYVPDAFTTADYRAATAGLGVVGGAVVSGSFQACDQSYLLAALRSLGPDFVGVTQLPFETPDRTITELDAGGVRAVRFNVYRGPALDWNQLERFARRVHDVAGWHSEFYLDAQALPDLERLLSRLPGASVDHLGLTDDRTRTLLSLVEKGLVVKATGFGRMGISDPEALMRTIDRVNPAALVFGTDLPSTRAREPFQPSDLDRVIRAVGPDRAGDVVLGNARRLYRLD